MIIEVHDHRPPNLANQNDAGLHPSTLHRLSGGSEGSSLLDRTRFPLYGNSSAKRRARVEGQDSSVNTGPEVYRIVLHATGETVWQDLKDLDADMGIAGVPLWSDEDALKVEAKILVSSYPFGIRVWYPGLTLSGLDERVRH